MAVKTITVTEGAYDAMKSLKRHEESFSELFLRVGKGIKVKDLAGILKASPDELKAFHKRLSTMREEDTAWDRRVEDVRARLKRID